MSVIDLNRNRQYVEKWKKNNYDLCITRHRLYNKKYYLFTKQVKILFQMYDAMV